MRQLLRRGGGPPNPTTALVWSFANTAVGRLGPLVIGIALARLLGPEAFGTYAVAFLALVALLSFNELGVSLAIVRWEGDPARIAPTVTTISVAFSALLTGVSFVVAPWFTAAMGDPEATSAVRLLGLAVLINGFTATPAALLQRQFRQDTRTAIDQVNTWLGALTSIGLALAGMGAMSLVVGRLAGAAVAGVMFVVKSPAAYRFGFDRSQARALLAFGLPLAGASVVVLAAGYADQVVVGRVLGPVALGLYAQAVNLSSWPVTLLSQPLRAVAPALFARLQSDRQQMRGTLGAVARPLAAVALPACLAISAAAPQIVTVLYGPAWLPAADALRWLAVLAAVRIFMELGYDYLVVLGRSRALLAAQAIWLAALLPAVWLGAARGGITGAALAQAAVAVLVVVPIYLGLLRREGPVGVRSLAQVGLSAVVSVAMAAVAVQLGLHLSLDAVSLAVTAGVALATAAALLAVHRSDLRGLRAVSRLVAA